MNPVQQTTTPASVRPYASVASQRPTAPAPALPVPGVSSRLVRSGNIAPSRSHHGATSSGQPVRKDGSARAPEGNDDLRPAISLFKQELHRDPCRLDLVDCAEWFKETGEKGVLTAAELRRLDRLFPYMLANTPRKNLDSHTMAWWTRIFLKASESREHLQAVSPLLAKAADLIKGMRFDHSEDLSAVAFNLKYIQGAHAQNSAEPLLEAIACRIFGVSLPPRDIARALFGLQNMRSSAGTQAVLQAVAMSIPDVTMQARDLADAFQGFKNMQTSAGTGAVVGTLARQIPEIRLSAGQIGKMLFSVQNLHSDQDTEALLLAMAPQIDRGGMTQKAVVDALYGLQNMQTTPAADAVLQALSRQLGAVRLDALSIVYALYGLRNMKVSPGTKDILDALGPQVGQAALASAGLESESDRACCLAEVMHSLKHLLDLPAASRLIDDMSHRLRTPIADKWHSDDASYKAALMGLLSKTIHVDSKKPGLAVLDLNRLSSALGAYACAIALPDLLAGNDAVIIDCGTADPLATNTWRMRQQIENLLKYLPFKAAYEDAVIRVEK